MSGRIALQLEGDELLAALSALANPHRLRIIASLVENGSNYVSRLARDVGISRPLLHLHLKKLEEAGLVTSTRSISQDGKTLNYFSANAFLIELSPALIAAAAPSLTDREANPPH